MKLGIIALGLTIASVFVACPAPVATTTFKATLAGSSEVPPVTSSGTGTVTVVLNETTKQITVDGTYSGLTSAASVAHIHGPAAVGVAAGVIIDLTYEAAISGKIGNGAANTLTDAQITDLKAGLYYVNVHSVTNTKGELRGQLIKQ